MATNLVKFHRGLSEKLPAAGELGHIYITTDDGAIYYGTGSGMLQLGVTLEEAESAIALALEETVGLPEGAESTIYEIVNELKGYVGTFTTSDENIDTVVEYIDAKTANIASDERVNGIEERVEAVEGNKADKSVVEAMYTNAQIDGFIAGAKDYADANDANTTYTLGYESKVDGEGGHPARIILTPSEGEPTYVDATPFIKDGMLDNVAYNAETNTLTFTFNTDAGKEDVTVELTDILAPYIGSNGARIKVEVTDGVISADLEADSIDETYLAESVKGSLDLAKSAIQSHQDISHLATKEEISWGEF